MIQFKNKFPNCETHSEELKLKNKENSKKGVESSKIVMKNQAEERLAIKIKEFDLLDKRCQQCNDKLVYKVKETKFCNSSCAAKYSNARRTVKYTLEAKEKMRLLGLEKSKNFVNSQKNY